MKTFCNKSIQVLESLRWLPLLCLRLILAYGFLMPALQKLKNFDSVVQWFTSLNIPFPYFSAVISTTVELTGVVFLFLGFLTRIISIPLMFLMFVAISTVHWANGFAASANGFEIPLYYFLMLLCLFVFGPGGISIDTLIKKRWLTN
ncbi:MAG: DoxX family protein [Verrucomicrobia bacterium]|nr:DoxX family protein [Verrucomicrobiota bacterium]